MRNTFWKTVGTAAMTILMMAVTDQFRVSAQDTAVKEDGDKQVSNDFGNTRRLEGVWRTAVTPRNCATGVPIPSGIFQGLFTFHRGGTMSEWGVNAVVLPTMRSPGHGVWQREQGSRDSLGQNYSFTFTFLRYNTTGMLTGRQQIRGTLELGASGDEFTTDSNLQVLDLNGNVLITSCANAVGTRFDGF